MPWGQYNIARARWPLDDPRMKDFMDAVDQMNALVERSPGFLWRELDEEAMQAQTFPDDPLMTMTLSMWSDIDGLRQFTWNTVHKRYRLRRGEWFEDLGERYLVMWQVPEGHQPTAAEALENLLALRRDGPCETRLGTEALVPEGVKL